MINSDYKQLPKNSGCLRASCFSGEPRATYLIDTDYGDVSNVKSGNLGVKTHAHKVAGNLASASGRLHWLDRFLLCDFNGVSLFVRL